MKQLVYDLAALLLLAKGPGVARGEKKFQANWSSRLAGYTQHIYECLVFYIEYWLKGPTLPVEKKIEKNVYFF